MALSSSPMLHRALAVLTTLALLACAPLAVARAQETPETALASVREMILYARYQDAIAAARAAVDRDDFSAAERNTALELLATAQIANRQVSDATQTLALLYSRDPGHRLTDPDASPPVVSAFARAREAHPALVPVVMQHQTPRLAGREPPTILVRVSEGADAVAEMRLAYRYVGESAFSQVVMNPRPDGSWMGRIPVVGRADSSIDVAYYITALAPSSTPLASEHSEADPLQLRIPAEAPSAAAAAAASAGGSSDLELGSQSGGGGGSVAEEAWFWILIGVIVAGGVTAGVVVATLPQGPESGTLGTIFLEH